MSLISYKIKRQGSKESPPLTTAISLVLSASELQYQLTSLNKQLLLQDSQSFCFFTFFQQKPLRSEQPLWGCLFPDPVPSLPPPAPPGLQELSPMNHFLWADCTFGDGIFFVFFFSFFGEDSHRQLGLKEWNKAMMMIAHCLVLLKQIKVSKDIQKMSGGVRDQGSWGGRGEEDK